MKKAMDRILASHLAAAAAMIVAIAPAAPVNADNRTRLPGDMPEAYAQECGACHVPYPPGMLGEAPWRRIMAALGQHYGTDASLEAAPARQIEAWLQAHAGAYRRVREEPPQDRITRSSWYLRKHRDVEAATWQLPSVKSAANCAACHAGADRGLYDDDNLRYPAGLSDAQRRQWRD